MVSKYSTRREFFKYFKLSLLFLLSSCTNVEKRVRIALQKSFYPDVFKDILPASWQQKNINFGAFSSEKNRTIILDSEFTIINDGWVNNIDFKEFKNINNPFLLEKLDLRSQDFLNSFEEYQRNKLFPIGVVPYAVVVKNDKDLIESAKNSYDFLFSKKLTKKIIFPKSPRILMSIAKRLNSPNSIFNLKNQAMLFDDQNSLNWLINSDACVAIVPYTLCSKYYRLDSRLKIVFPDQGVPLMWHFILGRSNRDNKILLSWIKSLESKSSSAQLASQGWYLPFKNYFSQKPYRISNSNNLGPSQECWNNSWSFSTLSNAQKINLENSWNKSLIP